MCLRVHVLVRVLVLAFAGLWVYGFVDLCLCVFVCKSVCLCVVCKSV